MARRGAGEASERLGVLLSVVLALAVVALVYIGHQQRNDEAAAAAQSEEGRR